MKEIRTSTIQLNWQSMDNGAPWVSAYEAKFYTDTRIIGHHSEGPYQFINTIAQGGQETTSALPAIVLRVEHYIPNQNKGYEIKTNADHYHGGDHIDEVAALASLCMGIRLKAGAIDRHFDEPNEKYGRPIEYGYKRRPVLISTRQRQFPRLPGSSNLSVLSRLAKFADLPTENANSLVKSARLYQEALWIGDMDPAHSWLLFVSAVETAANQWSKDVRRNVATDVKEKQAKEILAFFPRLEEVLKSRGCEDLLLPLADVLAPYVGATKKFCDFLVEFLPAPPDQRCVIGKLSYDPDDLRVAVRKVYSHRSKALHGGVAFPAPMCAPPDWFSPDPEVQPRLPMEIPSGLATHVNNASWKADDTPMLLHTFEHIVRGALLKWWASMIAVQSVD